MKKKLLQEQKEKAIIETFAKTFNKIKRLDEQSLNEDDVPGLRKFDDIEVPDDVMKSFNAEAEKHMQNHLKSCEESAEKIKRFESIIDDEKFKDVRDAIKKMIADEKSKMYNCNDMQSYKESMIHQMIRSYRYQVTHQDYENLKKEKVKTAKITKEQIIDVFVTALEGGSNHWYFLINIPNKIKQMTASKKPLSEACGEYVLQGGNLPIYDKEEVWEVAYSDEDRFIENGRLTNDINYANIEPIGNITMDSLLDAITTVQKDYPNVYENIIMEEYDAGDADVFFQIAALGDVVYG